MFSDFQTLGDDKHYEVLPRDWFVVITDVRGSTKAIDDGRYQDVNTLGAASVAVLEGLWQANDVPFVFGGDGASLLIPPSKLDDVIARLVRLRNFAKMNYDLELRVGVVPMSEVSAQGLDIWVAKFGRPSTKPIAFIRGGGLAWADTQIKSSPEKYARTDDSAGTLQELAGLSCRWQPLKARKGTILSLLARSQTSADVSIFPEILEKFESILGGDVQLFSPVNAENMKYKSYLQVLRSELKYHHSMCSIQYAKRFFMTMLSVWAMRHDRVWPFNAPRFRAAIGAHSDFRKFDDMLRLVLDCKPAQVTRIREYLETLYRAGKIYYGLHESDHAIMTCLVGSTADGDHIHFIDGGAGGYAVAAKGMKDQIAVAQSPGAAIEA